MDGSNLCEDDLEQQTKRRAWRDTVSANCPLLYSTSSSRPRYKCWHKSETQSEFSFECRDGWAEPLKKLSYELEMLNRTYGQKHRVCIEATQVKEKFGTLCFYHDVIKHTPSVFGRIVEAIVGKVVKQLNHLDYKMKLVLVKEGCQILTPVVLTVSEYLDEIGPDGKLLSDMLYKNIVVRDGKIHADKVSHQQSVHNYVATQHKILHWMQEHLDGLLSTSAFASKKQIADQELVAEFMTNRADDLIAKAEEECQHVCEECGRQIGTTWSPTCETVGWVAYLCDKCADKTGQKYIKDGAMYRDGKLIKTEAEVLKEDAINELKSVKRQAEYEEKQAAMIQKKRAEVEKLIVESLNIENKGKEYPLS